MVGLASMAEYAVVAGRACIKLSPEVLLQPPICDAMTAVGAAINTANFAAGSSAAVSEDDHGRAANILLKSPDPFGNVINKLSSSL